MSTLTSETLLAPLTPVAETKLPRIMSIDALRGFVMFVMIYVNDLDEGKSPWWMQHFKGPNGMTFVDLVFPAFIFIVGMAIPLAFTSRMKKGEPIWKLMGHVLLRTVSLLAIGILMVNSESHANSKLMGWSGTCWEGCMFLSCILAFCAIGPGRKEKGFRIATWIVRGLGLAGMIYLAFAFRGGKHGFHIIKFHPFSIRTSWYGILGLIGWAYLVASIAFVLFRTRRMALLLVTALLMCLYALDKNGAFDNLSWLNWVSVGEDWGTHAAIATAGVLLGTILLTADTASHGVRIRFALWFAAGCAAAALVVQPPLPGLKEHPPLWGVSKNAATPAWGLWACAATALLWAFFYWIADDRQWKWLAKPWAIAGQNVLLAYLISEGMESWLSMMSNLHWHFINTANISDWYDNLAEPNLAHAMMRSAGLGVVLLCLTAILNWLGFWVRL